jgi:hypothetical protein
MLGHNMFVLLTVIHVYQDNAYIAPEIYTTKIIQLQTIWSN